MTRSFSFSGFPYRLTMLVVCLVLFGPNPLSAEEFRAVEEAGQMSLAFSGACRAEKNDPVVGAQVRLYRASYKTWSIDLVKETKTNMLGRFTFTNVSPPRTKQTRHIAWFLVARKSGRASAFVRLSSSQKRTGVELKMPKAVSLKGKITDQGGKPIAGAQVWTHHMPQPLEWVMSARSDKNGDYEIKDLAPWNAGPIRAPGGAEFTISSYFFWASHPDYAKSHGAYTALPATGNITLPPAAVITGRVVFEDTEKPAMGAAVQLQGRKPPAWAHVITDKEGRYRITSLPAGQVNLWAVHEGWTVKALDGLEAVAGKTLTAPDLQLTRGGFITGRVINAETGEPVKFAPEDHADIAWYGPSRPRSGAACATTQIDKDGRFKMRVPAGVNYPYFRGARWTRVSGPSTVIVKNGKTVDIEYRVRRK